MTPKTILDLWMRAWVAYNTDSGVTVRGNEQCATSVIATLRFVIWEAGWPILVEPSREQLVSWMTENNMADEVEYLMEE